MMLTQFRNILLFQIGILFLYSLPLFSQNSVQKQVEYADSLYSSENYFDAVTEYKRLLFFDKAHENYYHAYKMMGHAYRMGGMLSDAIRNFTLAKLSTKNPQEIFECQIEIIKANILRRTTDRAIEIINELKLNPLYSDKINIINYWTGWVYIFRDEWDRAAEYFSLISEDHELKKIAEEAGHEKYSVTFAKVISYIVPGSGQIYLGNYLPGIISLGWNLFAGYLTVNSLVENRIFDGVVTANFLWLRFYAGNIYNAGKAAEEKNLIITNNALRYLQNQYRGDKP